MLFPLHLDGTLHDHLTKMQETKTFFPTITVMHIFQQVSILLMMTLSLLLLRL
jgi:serine/threonine kinase 16